MELTPYAGFEVLEVFWQVRQRSCDGEHVTRVDFRVSTLTLSAPDLKRFLKSIG